MKVVVQEHRKRGIKMPIEVLFVATAFAVVLSICDWFLLGVASQWNLSSADFNENPWLNVLLLAHAPAVLLYITIFGKPGRGSDAAFLFCVFVQWFAIGIGVGLLVAGIRRALQRK